MDKKRLWVTWNTQRRNKTLSKEVGAEMVEFKTNATNFIRYPYLSVKTISLVLKKKPVVLFAQNPSLVLAALVAILGKIIKIVVVIDAHNAGIFPLEGKSAVLNKLALMVNSLADIVIVSNENLKNYLVGYGVVSVAIPDPIPKISNRNGSELDKAKFNVVYVCSWSADEPYLEVIQAVDLLDDTYRIYVTGKGGLGDKKHELIDKDGLILTGFLSEEEYESLLLSCDAVMVLTEREDCLVCGAYEGVAVGKPLIPSDTNALRGYFNSGAVYVQNSAIEISMAIIGVKEQYQQLDSEVKELKWQCEKVFQESLGVLDNHLNSITDV